MNTLSDLTYNWKQAASQEAVDYDAVQKSFMDQAYGVVANKAKILFQDPFRLGFEIVNRNEKATKMVGIFAFRVNKELLYAPVFFVNGEIKSADMLYRTSVKRFVPLTEKWCAHLVRGVGESSGQMVDKNRAKQPDAYMHRLAYPQHTKYAAEVVDELSDRMLGWLDTACKSPEPAAWLRKRAAIEPTDAALLALAEMTKDAGQPGFLRSVGVGVAGSLPAALLGGIPLAILAEKMAEKLSANGYGVNPKTKQMISKLLVYGSGAAGGVLAQKMDGQYDPSRWDDKGNKLPAPEEAEEEEEDIESVKEAFRKAAANGSIFRELMEHCADTAPVRKLIPEFINVDGPAALEKLASIAEAGPQTERCIAEYYTEAELTSATEWLAKSAGVSNDPEAGCIVLVTSVGQVKSAAERESLFDHGYSLIDKRPSDAHNVVVEEISDGTVTALSTPGEAHVLLDDGSLIQVIMLTEDYSMLRPPDDVTSNCLTSECYKQKPTSIYIPSKKELLDTHGRDVFGDTMLTHSVSDVGCKATEVRDGTCYIMINPKTLSASSAFCVQGKRKSGDSTIISVMSNWGEAREIVYAPDREREVGCYVSDNTRFAEVDCDVERRDDSSCGRVKPKKKCALMSSAGIDKWIRTAGGLTTAQEVTVRPKADGVFDLTHKSHNQVIKSARDLGRLEAHLMLAEDFCLTVDKAGELLDKAANREKRYRVYDSLTKKGFTTRMNDMESWVEGFDPSLQVKVDTPQRQVISTYTPTRPDQTSRYGDVYNRAQSGLDGRNSEDSGLIPTSDIFQRSPEELAYMSQKYDMPHIFDHGCLGRMASSGFNMADQIKQYVPDLEVGLDRLYRILFLIRYRPAEFEESYGRDSMLEMEQELADLTGKTGEALLRLLQRFDVNQYNAQEN